MTAVAAAPPRAKRRFTGSVGLLALPIAVWLVFFFIVPFGLILWYSFGEKPSLYVTHSNDVLSLARYVEALDPAFLTTFWRTTQISITGTALCLLIGFPIAYWMAVKLSPRARGIVLALVLVPYWTNFLVRTIGWQITLSPEGFLSDFLNAVGVLNGPLQVLYTQQAVQLGVVYNYLPLMILPLYVALERMDHRLLEASRDLGGSWWSSFWRVTVPLARPGIMSGMILVFVPLMGDYITPSVLGGASGSMVGQMVAGQFQRAQNWALGSAMAIVLMLAILLVVIAFGVLFKLIGVALARFRHLGDLDRTGAIS
ncbi:spermidine/putrescine transport system permease protein [Labedella gwakjiensis]|uniref:ABC transporter permease n=1 Tax=Labedella gwakjiensis TaxID=390269 RepID=A0A2P8GSL0_9MICO|nr:ABC transporter permease [Labedella gwakjiensis]PSL36947.1 spermidine/putrescine transport system permease protein [Labedella gwakjiensis]RUQ81749.1 ABC transporter permease [Labedella gwakjiensis]